MYSESGALYEAYDNLAKSRAKRFHGCGAGYKELEQIARIGLWRATKGYRQRETSGFAAYAIPFIDGELRNFIGRAQKERNKGGNKKPHVGCVEYFGNAAVGATGPDISLDVLAIDEPDHDDDDAGENWADNIPDNRST